MTTGITEDDRVATNAERREAAQRQLEQQLEQRAQREKRQRLLTVIGAVTAIAIAVGAIAFFVFKGTKHDETAPATAAPKSGPTDLVRGGPDQLPAFKAPADLGANCQYPAAEKSAKKVDPPKSGKVPTDPDKISVSMATNQGNIGLWLNNAEAPCTVNSFASLAQKGFFDDTLCHRLTTAPGLGVLQCGDPSGTGGGGPGYKFANEYPTNQYPKGDPALQKPVLYPRGTLAMANAGPDTNGSQFFLVYKDSQLPPNYTVFGSIDAEGLATLDKIAEAKVAGGGDDGAPATEVTVKSVLLD
jgi:peptidyl-prolyl cis-trans isomerase B (cyclophilin B)